MSKWGHQTKMATVPIGYDGMSVKMGTRGSGREMEVLADSSATIVSVMRLATVRPWWRGVWCRVQSIGRVVSASTPVATRPIPDTV